MKTSGDEIRRCTVRLIKELDRWPPEPAFGALVMALASFLHSIDPQIEDKRTTQEQMLNFFTDSVRQLLDQPEHWDYRH